MEKPALKSGARVFYWRFGDDTAFVSPNYLESGIVEKVLPSGNIVLEGERSYLRPKWFLSFEECVSHGIALMNQKEEEAEKQAIFWRKKAKELEDKYFGNS